MNVLAMHGMYVHVEVLTACLPACPLPPYHAIVQLIMVSVQFEGVKISIPIQVESIGHHNRTTMNPMRIGGAGQEPRYQVAVTVEDPPISFSPFSSIDCTMLSHFSFNDFVAVAFPDLAGDLDIQL